MEERDGIQDGTEEMGSESVNVQISVNKAVASCRGWSSPIWLRHAISIISMQKPEDMGFEEILLLILGS